MFIQSSTRKPRIAALAALVAVIAVVAGSVADSGESASWGRGVDWQGVANPTQVSMQATCDTTYRSNGTKVWTIKAFVNIRNALAGDVITTVFGLRTSTGYVSPGYVSTTRFTQTGNSSPVVYSESNVDVPSGTPARRVVFAFTSSLTAGGRTYQGPAEVASHGTQLGGGGLMGLDPSFCTLY